MLKTAMHKMDITRRDLKNFAAMTAILGVLFGAGAEAVTPAAHHAAICSTSNLVR